MYINTSTAARQQLAATVFPVAYTVIPFVAADIVATIKEKSTGIEPVELTERC